MRFILFLILAIALIFSISIVAASSVNINFEVKDENGNPLPDSLIIIQGITNSGFSASKLTDSSGKASFTLTNNEVFIYIVYKLSYKEQTGSFFTSGNKNFVITLEKLSSDQWFFYLLNNGEIEFRFKSLDDDTNYKSGDYIREILETRNVAGKNIKLFGDKSIFQTVDSQTTNLLRAWGSFSFNSFYGDFTDITLKKDGWIRVTLSEDMIEVCAGNLIVTYGGKTIELSGQEFLCTERDQQYNKIPDWILKNKYRLKIDYAYGIDGQEKQINFVSQEFFIDNVDWKPEIVSVPETDLIANEEWTYNIKLKEYDESFSNLLNMINYKLIEAPNGMAVDKDEGVIRWIPVQNGNYNVVARAYYEYFENNSEKITYTDQEFTLNVSGGEENNPPVITSTPVTSANEKSIYTYDVEATDADGDILIYNLAGPNWLSINANTGLITGMAPEVTEDTNLDINVSVSDGTSTITQNYVLTVMDVPPVNNHPVITSTPVTSINEGANYNYQIVATDADNDTLIYNLTQSPNWLSINSTTGLISGIAPGVNANTDFTITISVTDGTDTTIQSYTLTIINIITPPTNNLPVITSSPVISVNETKDYSYQVTAIDVDNDTLIYTLTQAPTWLSVNSNTGLINGTAPNVDTDTNYNVSIRVSDGIDSVTQNYILTVENILEPVNNLPVIISIPITSVDERENYTYDVNASDADGDTLTYSLTLAPSWLSINSQTGLISGIAPLVSADSNFLITISVSDGTVNVTQSYVLIINDIPKISAPRASSGGASTGFPSDISFENQKYLKQFNAPKIVISNIPAANVPALSSQKSKLEATEKILRGLIIPILITLNLILTISIIFTIKPTKKNIIGGNLNRKYLA